MKKLAYSALFTCLVNIVLFAGVWELLLLWGIVAILPLTMIIYWRLREKQDEDEI